MFFVIPNMLMRDLIAQAIFLIHIFDLQLCVAMDLGSGSGSRHSIQNPGLNDLGHHNHRDVVFLRLEPTEYTGNVYYVTVTKQRNKMKLKLTETRREALPIGDSSGSGVDLPLSVFISDGGEGIQLKTPQTPDSGLETRFEFVGGKIRLPTDHSLYRQTSTGSLVVKRSLQGEEEMTYDRYEQMEQMDPERIADYGRFTDDREKCEKRIRQNGLLSVLCFCFARGLGLPQLGYIALLNTVPDLIERGLRIFNAANTAEVVWMNLNSIPPAR